jgi:hypothetical protein
MTITLKTSEELKLITQSGDTNKKIDDKLQNLINFVGGNTINVDEFEIVVDGAGGKVFTFIANNLSPERNMYGIKFPENWCSSYDLEDNSDRLFCASCGFTINPDTPYHFADGKILVSGTAGTADAVYEKDTYNRRLADQEDLICPVCNQKNRFKGVL